MVVVLDEDWSSSSTTGWTEPAPPRTKELSRLRGGQDESGQNSDGMGGMDGGMDGGMGGEMQSALLGGAGDITYPHYLVNGKTPDAPSP